MRVLFWSDLLEVRGRVALSCLIFVAIAALSGCGVSYTSPKVETDNTDLDVRIIPLAPGTIAEANRSTYTPRALPDAFYSAPQGGRLQGLGALPQAPVIPLPRPAQLRFRPPPDSPALPYQIGVGDVVSLTMRGSGGLAGSGAGPHPPDTRQTFTVRDDGTITLPKGGRVLLVDTTLAEAEDRVFQALVAAQIDPAFSLDIEAFNSQKIAVGGSVAKVGFVPITLTTPTLADALTISGGTTVRDEEFASIRLYRDGTLYQIPFAKYLADPSLGATNLRGGDLIFVDISYDLDRAMAFYRQQIDVIALRNAARGTALKALETEITLQRQALLDHRSAFEARTRVDAEPRDFVYLAGEVKSQTRFPLPYGQQASLADVLYSEGGFDTTTGDPAQIYVLRGSDGDQVVAYHLNTRNAANIILATKLQMRPNDVVFIEEQEITKWNRSLQQLLPTALHTAASAL